MLITRNLAWLLVVGSALLSVSAILPATADDDPASGKDVAERVSELIQQLDADRFADRQAAQEALIAIGKPAIEAVGRAATSRSPEVANRSLDILKKLYDSPDEATKTAAKAALQKLADGEHARSARKAKAVLQSKEPAPQQAPGGGQVIIGNAQFNIQGGNKRVSVKTVNGQKTIEVQEGDKKTKILVDPKGAIKAEVTTKKDGMETTKKIEAKNADELKKKDKEVYDLYQQYSKNNALGQIQIQLGNIGGRAIPIQPLLRRPQRIQADMAARLLQSLSQQISRLTGQKQLDGASEESLAELQKQVDAAKKQLAELEKRIHASKEAAQKEEKEEAKKDGEKP